MKADLGTRCEEERIQIKANFLTALPLSLLLELLERL